MTTETRLIALASQLGKDMAVLAKTRGDLAQLPTTAKDSLVAAIIEIHGLVSNGGGGNAGGGVIINDTAGDGNTTETWSANKIFDSIVTAKEEVRTSLLNGAGAAFDTLKELADALGNDPAFATTVSKALANRVSFAEAQTLTQAQKKQACDNIGIGDPEMDLLTAYTTARGAI